MICSLRMIAAIAMLALSFSPSLAQTQPPAQAPAPGRAPFGEEVMLAATPIVFVAGKSAWDNAFATLVAKFESLQAFLDKQNLKPTGPAMTIYTLVTDAEFHFRAAVPVGEVPTELAEGLAAGRSPEGKALKFVHHGSYDAMDMLYEAITNYLDVRKIERLNFFIEEYVTDPVTTPEDKLVVNVYVPIK